MVTDICKDEVIYTDNDTWDVKPVDIEKAINKYNNSPKRFLFYPWGVFITAYSRAHLWQGIMAFGDSYIYSDTDSLKVLDADNHMNFIEYYNDWCRRKCELMCEHLGIDPEGLRPKTIDGIPKPIGVWEEETTPENGGIMLKFKSLGAKRYLYQHEDKSLHMTVAGVDKKVALPYLIKKYGADNIFDVFKIGLHLPKGTTGKLTHVYIDYNVTSELTDYNGNKYQFYDEPPAVYLEAGEYDFSISEDYYKFLKGVQMSR